MDNPVQNVIVAPEGYEDITEDKFFECGAVDLAKKLLGKYLFCPQSQFTVRIVETEAYPHGDAVYDRIIGDVAKLFPKKAGVMVRLSAGLHDRERSSYQVGDTEHIYITAQGTEDCRDVVLLRSCEPFPEDNEKIEKLLDYNEKTSTYMTHNLMMNPQIVAKALEKDRDSNPVLYEAGTGIKLVKYTKATARNPGFILASSFGKRVLSKSKFPRPCDGSEKNFRFVLHTPRNYEFIETENLYLSPTPEIFN